MKNTTKLKYILQLYTIQLDMEDDGNIQLTITDKRTGNYNTFIDRAYSIVIGKAFSYMNKKLKESLKENQ